MSIQSTEQRTNPKTWAIIVWALYALGYITVISVLIGVIIAYVKREELRGTPFASHMTSAIRTFWIGLIVGIVGFVLTFVGIGIVILFALVVWNLFRIVRGLIRAVDGRPIEDPEGWL